MPRPRALDVQGEGGGEGQHPQGVRGRGAVDHDAVPTSTGRELTDRVQTEHFLDSGQRGELLGSNAAQLRIRKSPIEGIDNVSPAVFEQRQGVQR